jgi:hypothetical protein
MTPRRIGWFLSLQDVWLTTTAHIANSKHFLYLNPWFRTSLCGPWSYLRTSSWFSSTPKLKIPMTRLTCRNLSVSSVNWEVNCNPTVPLSGKILHEVAHPSPSPRLRIVSQGHDHLLIQKTPNRGCVYGLGYQRFFVKLHYHRNLIFITINTPTHQCVPVSRRKKVVYRSCHGFDRRWDFLFSRKDGERGLRNGKEREECCNGETPWCCTIE